MKATTELFILAILSACQLSCSVGPIATMAGETASVRLQNGNFETVEIIAVGDSSILCLPPPGHRFRLTSQVEEIFTDSIARIKVSGFRNDNWWISVLCFEVLPAVGLTAAASSANADAGPIFAAAMIPAVLTTVLYAGSGVGTPTFEQPMSTEKMIELRKYARFGGKLTPSQKELLLGTQQQTATY